jgi:hypothetical protein
MENKNNGLFQDFVLEFEAKDKLFKEYSLQFRARLNFYLSIKEHCANQL